MIFEHRAANRVAIVCDWGLPCLILASLVLLHSSKLCPVATAQDGLDPPDATIPDTSVNVSPTGVQRFAKGKWAAMSAVGINPSDQDTEEVVSVYLGDHPDLQFSRRFWLPAHSKRQTWLPIQIPPATPLRDQQITSSMMRIVDSGDGEVFTENRLGMPLTKRSLMLTNAEINTGLILEPPQWDGSGMSESSRADLYTMLYAARDSAINSSLELSLVNFRSDFLPPTHRSLDALDQMVIADDHLKHDTSGLLQLRQWLRDGGRIWIMLDRVASASVQTLLGDDMTFSTVDRVQWNDFQIEAGADRPGQPFESESWSSEIPVEMVRVMGDFNEVSFQINGMPAAFWQPVGRGEVLFTTASTRAWMQPDQTPGRALYELSQRFFEPRMKAPRSGPAMIPMLDQEIGYQIPQRWIAGLVLGINALLILGFGCWWAFQRRLERMAILIPVSALTSAVLMILVGNHYAKSVPSTVATGQVVRVFDATDQAEVSTVHSVYSSDAGDLALKSNSGTLTLPLNLGDASQHQRLVWNDDQSSQSIGLTQPPGVVRHFFSDSTVLLDQPLKLRGTFDAKGFRGKLQGLGDRKWEDAVIVASPGPATAVVADPSERAPSSQDSADQPATLVATTDNLLAPDQFISGALLSDTQRMRQEFYRRVFATPEEQPFGRETSLLIWTDPLDLGDQFADRFARRGTALLSVPIQIDTPVPDADFQVPATFIRTETFAGHRGVSFVFNPRTGRWLSQLTKPTETELLFRFPAELATMTLKQVRLKIKLNAPSRSLIVQAMVDGQPTTVYEQSDPSGTIEFTIDRADALQWHRDHGLWLSIGISKTQQQVASATTDPADDLDSPADGNAAVIGETKEIESTTWQIDFIQMEAVGRIESDPGTTASLATPHVSTRLAGTP
ncbi:hypothetical protein NHH03_22935 [Stieleria sp. TO1_6]|uniref:hypothetical protein n=1 Tax=Stieleria tagensis TaxID=2956795 RepID=UPI00209AD888|nr:hypothetical protein [Stieleria tagensis]MCO8124612.1 hypothetical protein [Stieleria tagensis]